GLAGGVSRAPATASCGPSAAHAAPVHPLGSNAAGHRVQIFLLLGQRKPPDLPPRRLCASAFFIKSRRAESELLNILGNLSDARVFGGIHPMRSRKRGAGGPRSAQIVQVPIGLTAAAVAVVATLSALTWACWETRGAAAVLGPAGILAVFAFVLVAEIRLRAERIARRTVRMDELLAEHSTDMIVSFDPHTQFRTYVSPSCRRLYGYEPEEAMSMAATEIIHPDDFPAVEAALEKINGNGQGKVSYRARRKDGTYMWVEASLTASRNPVSGAVEIVSVVRDVSERVRSEEKLRKAKA